MKGDAVTEDVQTVEALKAMLVKAQNTGIPTELRKVTELRTHPRNARIGNLEVLTTSLKKYGQTRPIVVNKDGVILAGNHLYRAATEMLGWEEITVANFKGTEEEEEPYLLMDNRASDLSVYEDELQFNFINDMVNTGRLDWTGYTPDDVDDLAASIDDIVETAPEPFEGGYAETEEQREARRKDRGEQTAHREVVLLYEPEVYEQLITEVVKLRQAWGMNSTRDAIREAVRRCAAQPEART